MSGHQDTLLSSGISGLDDILRGGFPKDCLFLVTGTPGTGKTTLAIQFLLEGVAKGESCLYVTLSESLREITKVADSHGWDISKLNVTELVPSEHNLSMEAQLTVFNPSELELGETTEAMIAAVAKYNPKRIVLDSLSEIRLIAQNPLRYRRQVLALKQYFAGRDCTVLMLDDRTGGMEDDHLQSIAHGVVMLEQSTNDYGAERRRIRVSKMRGVSFRGGYHDFTIKRGGLDIFPRLIAAEHHGLFLEQDISTGNAGFDGLMDGGLPAGTSTLLLGPAGTGKSTFASQFAAAAVDRGERVAMFIFDENLGTFLSRSRKLGIPMEKGIANGLITVKQIDPAELSSGEFSTIVRRAVDGTDDAKQPAKMVIVDSLNGYLNAMPEEKFLTAQLHELFAYLGQNGVASILTVTQAGMIGTMRSPVDTTYLADNVVLFRFFEAMGTVRRAVSVVKKRNGRHERTIREYEMDANGIHIGAPLTEFQGILTGTPTYIGNEGGLMLKAKNAP